MIVGFGLAGCTYNDIDALCACILYVRVMKEKRLSGPKTSAMGISRSVDV